MEPSKKGEKRRPLPSITLRDGGSDVQKRRKRVFGGDAESGHVVRKARARGAENAAHLRCCGGTGRTPQDRLWKKRLGRGGGVAN